MTYNPLTLRQLGAYWVTHGGVNLGVVGNTAHTKGYHLGKDRIFAATGEGWKDYSVLHDRDRAGLTNAASAIDLGRLDGTLANLRSFSRWLVAEATEHRDDYRDIREVIYTPDGKTVQRWSGIDGKVYTGPGNGDSSHLTHTHISFFRDSETRDKRPLFAGYFIQPPDTGTGDDVPGLRYRYLSTATGLATVKGDGHSIIRVFDKGRVPVPNGQVRETFGKVELLEPLDANAGDRKTGYLVGKTSAETSNYEAAFVLASDVTYKASPQYPPTAAVEVTFADGRRYIGNVTST